MPGERGTRDGWPPPSLEAIYRDHWRYVWRCARKMGIPDDRLDDVVQDVFIVIGNTLGSFEGRAKLRTWIYSITFRVAQEHHRKRAREQRADPGGSEGVEAPSPEQHLERVEAASLLQSLLAELDDDQRLVFSMAELDGVSPQDIARQLSVSVNTVYSRLRLARRKLERAIERTRARVARQDGRRPDRMRVGR
ncbi:MAG: sigma-70 family RNA polymerase sigma factor [Myxococcota bacterium]